MQHIAKAPDPRACLTDLAIAKLLGISLEEYGQLNCLPIDVLKDTKEKIIAFYIPVSTNNDPGLLSKLDLDDRNYVILKPDDIYKMYS